MNTTIKLSGIFFLTALFSLTSMVAQAKPILVSAESGNQVPIEGKWEFPGCEPDDEYEGPGYIKEFLIFTGDQVEGRVVQYGPNDTTCSGEETIVESETATVFFADIQEDDTCWDGDAPPRQDSNGQLSENPVATWLIYWLGEGETETGLFYIDDTTEPWYLWRYSGEEENGGEENLTLESDCMFPLSSDEPLIKVSPTTVSVTIDIKPGSDRNPVNSRSKGVIPVAVLGSIDFDATQIDYSTVTFGPDDAPPKHDGHVEDVNEDSIMDMMFHFKTQETGIVCGDTEASLMGETFGEAQFTGTDAVKTVGCKKAKKKKKKKKKAD